MQVSRRTFLGGVTAIATCPLFAEWKPDNPYETADGRATDPVFVRRVTLALAGRLPTAEEARAFVESSAPRKREELVDRLLASEGFADYWSMRFCDILRVKSEFPINLWPNAVYVYHRRIREFVKNDEPWDSFASALLTAKGSDFRDAEANFYRAVKDRNAEGFAEAAALTFLGEDWREVADVKELAPYFENVRVKRTREWKEEIVTVEGEDRRGEFVKRLLGKWEEQFAAAMVSRVNWWLFGWKDQSEGRRAKGEGQRAEVEAFIDGGYRLKQLVRSRVLSDDFAKGPLAGGFNCRRLDAEVLEDAIVGLTGISRSYESIAPEPFTFLPPQRKTVLVEDGSITSAFLLLFGRPARDSGLLEERLNDITAKQRLYLFNSGKLFNALNSFSKSRKRGQNAIDMAEELYWRFYSRPPTSEERSELARYFRALPQDKGKTSRARWSFPRDVAWALLNSREFLYQH